MNKVIMVVIDGLKEDVTVAHMGYLAHLTENGLAARYSVLSELPSLSRPLYEVLLTGVPPYKSGITANSIVRLSHQKSLFHLVRDKGGVTAAAAYYWVSELYNRAPFEKFEDRWQIDVDKPIRYGSFYMDDEYPDSHLFLDAEHMRKRYDPHFLYIHPMGVDNTGHKYGSDSKAYRAKAGDMSDILAELVPVWIGAGYNIVITADHGMNVDGEHGGTGGDERHISLFGIGEAFVPAVYEERIGQLSVAPLVCALLGIAPSAAMSACRFPGLRS